MKKLLLINILLLCGLFVVYTNNAKTFNKYLFEDKVTFNFLADKNSTSISKINKDIKKSKKINPNDENYGNIYNEVVNMIKRLYVEDVNENKFFKSSLSGMLSSLDPHSAYYDEEQYNTLLSDTQGEFSGLGIEVTMENSFVKVVTPIDDSPAFKAGIRAGDYISEIDGKAVVGMSLSDAVKLMRGKDAKDRVIVKLIVLRSGEKEPLEFKIKRDLIKTRDVKGYVYFDVIYLRIAKFTSQTYLDMIKEFNKLENEVGKNNVKGLILDLRNNPGGLLDSSVLVSEAFLSKDKKIVSIKGKNSVLIQEFKSKKNEDLIPNIPMVVLINEGSASASEIVAAALQDNDRALIVGTQSFGKGSVQNVIPLNNNMGAVKLTIAKYYTPNDISIQAKGVTPNIEVKMAKVEEIDFSKWNIKEDSLSGHLENEQKQDDIVEKELNKQKQLKSNNNLYEKDYQLARAIDLLLGISFYNSNSKK